MKNSEFNNLTQQIITFRFVVCNLKNIEDYHIKERVIIQSLLGVNKSKSFIANKLGRSRSTISKEVNRWITKPGEYYSADIAD